MSDKQTKAIEVLRNHSINTGILIEDFIEYVENNGCDKYIFKYIQAKPYYDNNIRSTLRLLYGMYSEEISR